MAKVQAKAKARAKARAKASVRASVTTGALARLQAAIERRYPAVARKLRPGASDTAIARLVKASPGLPASFLEFMRWHDGAKDSLRMLDGMQWLAVRELLGLKQMMDDIVAGGHYAAFEPDEWWSRGWVQFADGDSGYGALVIDLHGSFGGSPGQVLWAAPRDPTRVVLAPSFDAWLETFAEIVERGYLEEDGDDEVTVLCFTEKASALFARRRGYPRRTEPRPVEVRAEAPGGALTRATRGARPQEVPASARWLVSASGAKVRHWFVDCDGKNVVTWSGDDLERLTRSSARCKDAHAAAVKHDEQLRKQLYAGFVFGGAAGPRPGDPVCALSVGDGYSAEFIDLSPDGRTLAIGTMQQDARGANLYLVDLETGRRRRIHEEKVGPKHPQTFIHRVAFGPGGAEIFYQLDAELRAIPRDGGAPKVLATMKEPPLNPHVSRFEFDGTRERLLYFDGPSPCVRRTDKQRPLLKLPASSRTTEYREATLSPSGELLAIVHRSRGVIYGHEDAKHDRTDEIQLWSVDRGKQIGSIPHGKFYMSRMAFTPDEKALVIGTHSSIVARDIRTGKTVWKREAVEWAHSPDGALLAVAERSVAPQILDAKTRRARLKVPPGRPWALEHAEIHTVATLRFSSDGRLLCEGNRGGRVYVWTLQ